MPIILGLNVQRALDLNGSAVPGARATFTNSGTTALRTVFADPACTIPHPNPLIADGAGVFAPVYDTGGGDAAVSMTTPSGTPLAGYPVDPVMRVSTDDTGAAGISFSPTTEIPASNVQAAIERLQTNIVAPLAAFGIGVTGNAPLLANLDATGIASGFYRYDGTTTGTFPTGVTVADGGIVAVWRMSATVALMQLIPANSDRIHARRLSTTWQAWFFLLDSTDTADGSIWRAGVSNVTYAPRPTDIRASMDGYAVGCGQTWQDFTASRTDQVSYQNSTSRPITVAVVADGNNTPFQVSADGTAWVTVGAFGEAGTLRASVSIIVPRGWFYRIASAASVQNWAELR